MRSGRQIASIELALSADEIVHHASGPGSTTNLFAAVKIGTDQVLDECRLSRDGKNFLTFLRKAVKLHAGKEIYA